MGLGRGGGDHVVVHESLLEGHSVEEAVGQQPARGDGDGRQIDLTDDVPYGVDPVALGRGVLSHGDVSGGVGLDAGGRQIEALGERLAADREAEPWGVAYTVLPWIAVVVPEYLTSKSGLSLM